jgi:hypothetical protein
MQRVRYFTFVMLIRMVQEKIPRNTTFLMPSDRLLSRPFLSQVLEFLSRHSITVPLVFNYRQRLLCKQCFCASVQANHLIH